MGRKLKKSANIVISDFNRMKRSCIVVKSKIISFICGIIIALSLKENSNCAYVKRNRNFKLEKNQRYTQPKSVFKSLCEKLCLDAKSYLTFVPTKIKHWRKFLNYLGFNLVIFFSKNHFRILNENYLRKNTSCKDIYLIKCDSDSSTKYHYDVIRKPDGYFQRFICKLCYKTGKNKASHLCQFKCYMCKSSVRHDRKLILRTTLCKKCNRYFYTKSCKNIHFRNNVCKRKKVCLKCDNLYIVRKKKEHKCHPKDYCRMCKCIHPPRKHFIRSSFKPPENFSHMLIFDFETFNNENKIVTPYLCVSRLYIIEQVFNPLFVNLQTTDILFEEKVFYGLDCGKDFFIYLTSGLVPKKTICFAHNGQAFDFYFILKHFYKNPYYLPSLVFNGTRLMQMIVKNKDLELKFIDSVNFIPFPLRKFPNIFGFSDSKTYFPYSFVDQNSIDYIGTIPVKTYFDINSKDQLEFNKFYEDESARHNENWNLKEVSIEYCTQDVHVLFCGLFNYLKLFYKVSKINPFT